MSTLDKKIDALCLGVSFLLEKKDEKNSVYINTIISDLKLTTEIKPPIEINAQCYICEKIDKEYLVCEYCLQDKLVLYKNMSK